MSSSHPFQYPNSLELINKINRLLKQNKKPEETFGELVTIYSNQREFILQAGIRISFENMIYDSVGFVIRDNCNESFFISPDGKKGSILLCLNSELLKSDKKVVEDQNYFLENLSNLISRYITRIERDNSPEASDTGKSGQSKHGSLGNHFLQKFLNKYTFNRDVYHDLMPFKVREILLISSLYDAYAIEKDGRFSEHMLGQYGHLNLTSLPRITAASSVDSALEHLRTRHFDLIIYMAGVDKKTPQIV